MIPKNKSARFVVASLAIVVLLCICVFSFLAVYMSNQSTRTINEVGTLYMSNMSELTSQHFETAIGLQLDQMHALVETVVSEEIHSDPRQLSLLDYNARVRGFEYLGFYHNNGDFEMLYGDPLTLADPEPFRQSLVNGERKAAIGADSQGSTVILLGAPPPTTPRRPTPASAWWARCPPRISATPSPSTRTATRSTPSSSGRTALSSFATLTLTTTTTLTGCAPSIQT